MTEDALKLVLLFDPEVRGYRRAAHNLTAAQVTKEFGDVSRAKIINQGRRHRASDPLKCKTCQSAALQATREENASSREGHAPEGSASTPAEADEGAAGPEGA